MPFKSKRSQSMMGKTNAKKSKQVHGEPSPDEAPVLATKRCRYGYPAPVTAKNAPPPSAHRPVRYARPPSLRDRVRILAHRAHVPPVRNARGARHPLTARLMHWLLLFVRRSWCQCFLLAPV